MTRRCLYERPSTEKSRGFILDVREVLYCYEEAGGVWVALTNGGQESPPSWVYFGFSKKENYKTAVEIMTMKAELED